MVTFRKREMFADVDLLAMRDHFEIDIGACIICQAERFGDNGADMWIAKLESFVAGGAGIAEPRTETEEGGPGRDLRGLHR